MIYDPAWDKLARAHLQAYPLCEAHWVIGKIVAATLVHHKVPLDRGRGKMDPDNLQSLCAACHNRLHKGRKPA